MVVRLKSIAWTQGVLFSIWIWDLVVVFINKLFETTVFHARHAGHALRDEMEIDCELCGTSRKTDPVIDISRFDIIY